MKRSIGIIAALALLLVCQTDGKAAITIDFEGYSGGTNITTQYQGSGVDFTDAIVLQSPFYNVGGYPPHSGTNVIYSGSSNSIQADAVGSTWTDVSLYYTSAITGLYLEAYNSSDVLLASSFGGTNYGTNSLLTVSAADISYVKIHDSGNFFTIDDFAFTQTSSEVPEPATLTIWGLGALGCAVAAYRRKKLAA